MPNCQRCGVPFHPELSRCPLCDAQTAKEQARKRRNWFLINTLSVSFVGLVVIGRAVVAPGVEIGMTSLDCEQSSTLARQTQYAVELVANGSDPEQTELLELADAWTALSEKYVPGKYSWSTSGLEHNWLQRLGVATNQLATGEIVVLEGSSSPEKYVLELTKLRGRFCS